MEVRIFLENSITTNILLSSIVVWQYFIRELKVLF